MSPRSRLPLVWNPAWHHPWESVWSILAKLAWATATTLRVAARIAAPEVLRLQASLWHWCSFGANEEVAARLGVRSAQLSTSWANGFLELPAQRSLLNLGLRWCPVCLAGGFHSVLFQHRFAARCPWHDVALRSGCPRCLTPVRAIREPFGYCSCDQKILGEVPRNWLGAFRASPVGAEVTGLLPSGWQSRAHIPFLLAETEEGTFQLADPPFDDDYFAQWQERPAIARLWNACFEEHCALVERFLGPHLKCCAREPHPPSSAYNAAEFRCPAAAAIAYSLLHFEVRPLAFGGWPDHYWHRRLSETPAVLKRLFFRGAGYVSPELGEILSRAWMRSWLAESLEAFAEASEAGISKRSWDLADKYPVTFSGRELEVTVRCDVTSAVLEQLAERCDGLCPNRPKSTI